MFKIKSIVGSIHDSGAAPGCLPYKITVMVEIDVKEFNKLCPKVGKSENTMFGRRPARRNLGNLVLDVNNTVYRFNNNILAHYPSIDSNGDKRAKNGVKTLEFCYFMGKQDWQRAEALGFEYFKFKGQEPMVKNFQRIDLLKG